MNETNESSSTHQVPRARHAFDVKMPDGATIHVRQHGLAGAPRLVLSHGNGLAIDGYFPFWGPLRERYEVVLFDFRNHGHNPLHTLEGHTWQNFVADMDVVWCMRSIASWARSRPPGCSIRCRASPPRCMR